MNIYVSIMIINDLNENRIFFPFAHFVSIFLPNQIGYIHL